MTRIIFALDVKTLDEAREWVDKLKEEVKFFKVGLELFIRCGIESVDMIRKMGGEVFLDLKINDIPTTCGRAVTAAAATGAYSTTIHISSGKEALNKAVSSRISGIPRIWGVTVLSSIAEGDSLHSARLAHKCGLDGVIVSGKDLKKVKENFPSLQCIVPGVRPSFYKINDDQKRVLTPAQAAADGADYLVLGRPIRDAADPIKVVKRIKDDVRKI